MTQNLSKMIEFKLNQVVSAKRVQNLKISIKVNLVVLQRKNQLKNQNIHTNDKNKKLYENISKKYNLKIIN